MVRIKTECGASCMCVVVKGEGRSQAWNNKEELLGAWRPRYIHNLLVSFIFGVTILMDSQFSRTQYLIDFLRLWIQKIEVKTAKNQNIIIQRYIWPSPLITTHQNQT